MLRNIENIYNLKEKLGDLNIKVGGKQWGNQEFCSGGGVQQIQLRTEDRENGDLGAVAS